MFLLFDNSHIFALIGGFISTFASAFVLYYDDPRITNKANKKTFALLSFLGGFFTIIAALFSTIDNNLKTEKILTLSDKSKQTLDKVEKKSNKILSKNDSIASSNLKIVALTNENKNLLDENRTLNIEIRNLSKRIDKQSSVIENHITGGESFCYVDVSFPKYYKPTYLLMHKGVYQLTNVQVTISDMGKRRILLRDKELNLNPNRINEVFDKSTFHYKYDILYPNTAEDNIILPLDRGADEIDLSILIVLPNGIYREYICVKGINGRSPYSEELQVLKGNNLIFHRVRDQFLKVEK